MFQRAVAAMGMIDEAGLELSSAFTPTSFNMHQFEDVAALVGGFKRFTSLRVQPLMPMGRAIESENILPSEDDYRELVRHIEELNKRRKETDPHIEWGDPIDHLRRFEHYDWDQISFAEVKSDGRLAVSAYLPFRVGDLRRHSLREYWDAGLGKVWRLPVSLELARGVLCIGDLGSKKSGVPQVFYDEDLCIDLIDDKPFLNSQEYTLRSVYDRQRKKEYVHGR